MDSTPVPNDKGKRKATTNRRGKAKTPASGDDKVPVPAAFYWSYDLTIKLMHVLLAYQKKNGREQAFLWAPLTAQFEDLTGKKCNTNTLKNRTRDMKAYYNCWKELKKDETGLGWDPVRGTIMASDEWWEKKIAVRSPFVFQMMSS